MRRGEIWQVRLPFADGREQAGERPAILLLDDPYIPILPLLLAVPLTSSLSAARFAGTLVVDPTPRNGLRSRSVAMVFQVRGLDKRRFLSRIGEIEPDALERLVGLLRTLSGP